MTESTSGAGEDDGLLGPATLVDGHVHFHDCFEPAAFLDAAARNVVRAALELEAPANSAGMLMFTEGAGDRFFERFRQEPAPRSWLLEETGEPCTLIARQQGRPALALVAGRQIVTREDLEILALGSLQEIADGQPLDETLECVREGGALAVLAWGFGKWWGERGRIAAALVERERPGSFFLGDNGGRWASGPRSKLFERARKRGLATLPGSDPLPFARQVERVGSFGFLVEGGLSAATPFAQLRGHLTRDLAEMRFFGRGERLLPFVRTQIAMQLRKRLPKAAAG